MASLPNFRPSVVIACLLEKSHQAPAPMTAIRMIKTTKIWPDEFDREFIFKFFILETKTNAFDHFTVTNERAMSLFASVSAETISGIDLKMDQVAIEMLTFRP